MRLRHKATVGARAPGREWAFAILYDDARTERAKKVTIDKHISLVYGIRIFDTFEGIDIFGGVEAPPDHPLLRFDSVVLTPHVAAGSVEAMQDVARGSVENVVAILGGQWPEPANRVNLQVRPRRTLAAYNPGFFAELEAQAAMQE